MTEERLREIEDHVFNRYGFRELCKEVRTLQRENAELRAQIAAVLQLDADCRCGNISFENIKKVLNKKITLKTKE